MRRTTRSWREYAISPSTVTTSCGGGFCPPTEEVAEFGEQLALLAPTDPQVQALVAGLDQAIARLEGVRRETTSAHQQVMAQCQTYSRSKSSAFTLGMTLGFVDIEGDLADRVYYVDSAFQETLAEMHGWIEHALALRATALEQPHGSDVALCVNGHRNHAERTTCAICGALVGQRH